MNRKKFLVVVAAGLLGLGCGGESSGPETPPAPAVGVVEMPVDFTGKEAPGVEISAALFRDPTTDPVTVAQDWPRWCHEGWLDFVCHMDYVDWTAMFRSQVKTQMKAVGKVRMYPGIGLSCWQSDGQDDVKLVKQIEAVRALGLDGFTVFNFDRRAERVLPLLRTGVTKEAATPPRELRPGQK